MEVLTVLIVCAVWHGAWVLGINVDTRFPIVYDDPLKNSPGRGSYFGYSLVLHADPKNSSSSWIQIGAPRGNDTRDPKTVEPGVVFRCPIAAKCEQLKFEERADRRFKAWIGSAMDVQSPEDGGRVSVCGHRWRTITRGIRGSVTYYGMAGICYWLDADYTVEGGTSNVYKMFQLTNEKYRYAENRKIIDWSHAQLGISTHFPQNVSGLLMGAVGVYNWAGNAVECKKKQYSSRTLLKRAAWNEYEECTVTNKTHLDSKYYETFDYLGYSVNSGRFFPGEGTIYAAGAPRWEACTGRVLLFTVPPAGGKTISVKTQVNGKMVGEYFGSAMAVGDFTGDGLDDLVVGAPLFTRQHDEGCVYVFHGGAKGRLLQGRGDSSGRIIGEALGGRFGSALMTLGDLNHDGYADLAVGAPYEDENRGAVYIFHGGSGGLQLEYSQRIESRELWPGLRGFGASISRPADIDHNHYPDMAVGSFISGHAVVLRTRPIVKLFQNLSSEFSLIDRNSGSFVIDVCAWYTGQYSSPQLDVSRTIVVDRELRRASVGNVVVQNFTVIISLEHEQQRCEKIVVYVKNNITYEPIEIRMFLDLTDDLEDPDVVWINGTGKYGVDKFCQDCPVLARDDSSTSNALVMQFEGACGSDKVCEADLVLSTYFHKIKNSHYVLGSNKNQLEMSMDIVNRGEPAYSTQLEVLIPKPIELDHTPGNCKTSDFETLTRVTCVVEDPLMEHRTGKVTLSLDMSMVNGETPYYVFQVAAHTQSRDLNPDNNVHNLTLALTIEADMTIYGKPIEDAYRVQLDVDKNRTGVQFVHSYTVQKFGTSPVEDVRIEVLLPVSIQSKGKKEAVNFVNIHEPDGRQNGQPLRCFSDYTEQTGKAYLKDVQVVEGQSADQGPDDDEGEVTDVPRKKREVRNIRELDSRSLQLPANRTLFLNCSHKAVTCARIYCHAGPFHDQNVARLYIRLVANFTVLETLMGRKDIVHFSSKGWVTITKQTDLAKKTNKFPDEIVVSTIFLGTIRAIEVEDWVFAYSIGGGLLFLTVVFLGLVKAGFFQRKKKEALEALISAETVAEFIQLNFGNKGSDDVQTETDDDD